MIRYSPVAICTLVVSLATVSAQQVRPADAQVASIDRMTAMPFTAITITGSGFETEGLLVEFFGGGRLAVKVAPLSVTPTSIRVPVPVYIGSFGFVAGNVNVRIVNINRDGSLRSGSNTITGFRIQEPPFPESFNGQMLLNFLKAARAFVNDGLRGRLGGSTLGTPSMAAGVDTLVANLDSLITRVEALVPNASNRFSLGYIGGRDALANQDAIGFGEELVTAVLAGHAAATVGTTTTPVCGADEARAALDEAVRRANPDAGKFVNYFAATLNAGNCRTPEVAEAGLGVVNGAANVALGVVAGGASGPIESIAVPTLGVIHAAVMLSSEAFALGAALGQTSERSLEQVQAAWDRMKRLGEATLARPVAASLATPSGATDINERAPGVFSIYVTGNAFNTALAGAAPYRGGAATGDLKAVTVALSGSGRGVVSSLPAGIACSSANQDACSAQFASTVEVVLQAAPATGSRFAGWSGACSGTGACVLAMDTARSVTARFDPAP